MQIKAPSLPLLDRFSHILLSLVAALGVRVRERAVEVGIGEGVARRIRRVRNLVEALILRLQQGVVPRRVARAKGGTREGPGAQVRARIGAGTKTWASMPRRFGWLCPLVPCTERYRDSAAHYGFQLATLLAEPEMRRWLAMDPRIARALRPICRMLHVDLALLEVGEEALAEDVAEPVPVVAAPVAVVEPAPAEPPIVHWWQQKWAQ